jgi:alkyl sulfatase BDS1-like metallo-beta-lactamase superfamily hydrolase
VPDFLSPAWFAAVDGAELGTDPSLCFDLDQVVTGAPGGDARYRMTIRGGRLHASPAAATQPADATMRLSYRTAADLATGRRSAHDAFLAREIRFSGNLERVQELTAAFTTISDALATLGVVTTFPGVHEGSPGVAGR